MKSPPAKTPFLLVAKLSSSTLTLPHFVNFTPDFPAINPASGAWPIAAITISTGNANSLPGIGSGLLLPLASGSPSLFLIHSKAITLDFLSPDISIGVVRYSIFIASSSARLTSSSPAGISFNVLLYIIKTSLAPNLRDDLAQSIAVNPPPTTATLDGTFFCFPRLISFMYVIPCTTPFRSSPGISNAIDLCAPAAIYTASYFSTNLSNLSRLFIGLFSLRLMPSFSTQSTAPSILFHGNR